MSDPTDDDLPPVYLCVPTGSIKEYAMLYLLASIRNLDYPPDKLHLCFAITAMEDGSNPGYLHRMEQLIDAAHFPNAWTILFTESSDAEFQRWSQYFAVIKNLHEARKRFLDGAWPYFWLLGGDNLPPPSCLKRLLSVDADVTSAIINQRPNRGLQVEAYLDAVQIAADDPGAVHPVFWHHTFTPDDVRQRTDIDPRVRTAILQAWVNLCYFDLVRGATDQVYHGVNFGSGCSLLKRRVLEYCGYYLSDGGYHSEDVAFGQWATLYGFDCAVDCTTHCYHFDPNKMIY